MKNKRLKYFNDRRTTSHWAYPIRVNGKQPQRYHQDSIQLVYEKIKIPDLSMLDEKKIKNLIVQKISLKIIL